MQLTQVLQYHDYILNRWDESDPDKFFRFCDWFNMVEAIDLESDFLNETIKSQYQDYLANKTLKITQND